MAVAVQVITLPTSVSVASTTYVFPVPIVLDPTLQLYVGVMVPSSISVAAAVQTCSCGYMRLA